MNARAADFEAFFNAGGDIWMQSSNSATNYYTVLPSSVAANGSNLSGSTGFVATADGVAIGITDVSGSSMINGFATHNSFTGVSSALTVFETKSGVAVSIGIRDANIGSGGISTNTAPVATAASLNVTFNTIATGTLGASDVDGDALTYSIVSNGSLGTAAIINAATGTFSYTPNVGASGSDSFTFKANDGTVDSPAATVTVTIAAGANTAPVAADAGIEVGDFDTVQGSLGASDGDGDALTYTIVTPPQHGTVTITDAATGAFTYLHTDQSWAGVDGFQFKVSDGVLDSNVATVSVTTRAPTGEHHKNHVGCSLRGTGALDPVLPALFALALAAVVRGRYRARSGKTI